MNGLRFWMLPRMAIPPIAAASPDSTRGSRAAQIGALVDPLVLARYLRTLKLGSSRVNKDATEGER